MDTTQYTLKLNKLDKKTNTITTVAVVILINLAVIASFFVIYMTATYRTVRIWWLVGFILPALLCFIVIISGYVSYNVKQQAIVDDFVKDICVLYRQLVINDTTGMAKKLLINNKSYDLGIINGYNYKLRIYNGILHVFITQEFEVPPFNPQMGQKQYKFED